MSYGFLSLAALLAVGLKTSRMAQDDRAASQIAKTFTEDARQGNPPASPSYLDQNGVACESTVAAYTVVSTSQALPQSASLQRLVLQIIPRGAPDRVRTYAVVFPSP